MSEKRRYNRNRFLREGEYQRSDGRYRFRYIDEDGKEKNVYSWRLDKNDPIPKGKKRELSSREKEKQIEADLFAGNRKGIGSSLFRKILISVNTMTQSTSSFIRDSVFRSFAD